ncbi:MAG: 4Fe-4S binding protein [Sulfolobales archaeon]|nr:4Fe-4S binding protein [Sulfolobales archaeon]MCX8199065.1 4Fe-4S binding protein [Sulfolobales archaeon]
MPLVDSSLCKGCSICIEMCPRKSLIVSSNAGPSGYRHPVYVGGCIGCRVCEWFCPDFAIAVRCEA